MTHTLERVGIRPISTVEVLRDLEGVVVQLVGKQPAYTETQFNC